MKVKLILSTLLLLFGGLKLNAKYLLKAGNGGGKLIFISSQDSDRNEFNRKKKNTKLLVMGKSPASVLRYYEFYLQENDFKSADSLMANMIKSVSDGEYRLKISMVAYRYTSDAKTRLLFLSDNNRIEEYRKFFLKYAKGTLGSNVDKRTYYYNLVSLDSAVYKSTQDSSVRKQLSQHYNSLAWFSILSQKLGGVENYINQSIKYDPKYKYPYSNLPLLLLLKGRYHKARSLYMQYKDLPLDTPNVTYKDSFLEDFSELAKAGVKNKNAAKIIKLLNSEK